MSDWISFSSPIVLSLCAILFFIPLELLWPRLRGTKDWTRRLPVIAIMGILSYCAGWGLANLIQDQFVNIVKSVQLMSLAKLPLPAPAIFIVSFLLIDVLTYGLHRLSHIVPVLWRLHSIHHADEHVTAVTGHLHHPFETLFAYVFMMFFYVLLGIPVVVVASYIAVNSVHNIFTHADIALPPKLEHILRFIIVTPDMHRTHHSVDLQEGNSNFSQIFSIWDWVFRTYAHRPKTGERALQMGLAVPSPIAKFDLTKLLLLPFRR